MVADYEPVWKDVVDCCIILWYPLWVGSYPQLLLLKKKSKRPHITTSLLCWQWQPSPSYSPSIIAFREAAASDTNTAWKECLKRSSTWLTLSEWFRQKLPLTQSYNSFIINHLQGKGCWRAKSPAHFIQLLNSSYRKDSAKEMQKKFGISLTYRSNQRAQNRLKRWVFPSETWNFFLIGSLHHHNHNHTTTHRKTKQNKHNKQKTPQTTV